MLASNEIDPKRLLEHFSSRQDELIEKITELVEIESPSYDVEGNRAVSNWITDEFRSAAPDSKIDKVFSMNYGEHFFVRTPATGDSENRPVLLLGHTDTVHPLGSKTINPTRISDGKLYGCGGFDMKANIVVIIEALRGLRRFGLEPSRPIVVLLACDEEVGSETGRELVETEARSAEYCLVFEPSADGKAKTGRKGTGGYTLRCHGIPSHAGLEPKRGASAILEISRQIEKIHELTDFSIGTTVTVGTISGGTATNVVPAEAECSIDVRFETLAEANRIENELRALVPFDNRVRLEITGGINRPPMERTDGVIDLFEKARAIAGTFGYELNETQVGGASDGNFVGALGVPLLDGLGIKGDGAHTMEEYVEIEDIPFRVTLLTLLLLGI